MDIKYLIMDVDGTLTDGKIYMGANGEIMKCFNAKDGYAIAHLLPEHGINPVIITGRTSEILLRRCEELHITKVYQNVSDKAEKLRELMEEEKISETQIAYIGDDLNDLSIMKLSGLVGCPSDAAKEVQEISDYHCAAKGGEGAVREFIEWILANNKS